MNSLEVTGTTNYCGLSGVRVDGAILVDAGAQWNTSPIWSANTDGTAFENVNPVTNAYDRNLNIWAR